MKVLTGRDTIDELGLRALEDAYAAPTREELGRARATDAELAAAIARRLGPLEGARIARFSTSELAVLAGLERAAT